MKTTQVTCWPAMPPLACVLVLPLPCAWLLPAVYDLYCLDNGDAGAQEWDWERLSPGAVPVIVVGEDGADWHVEWMRDSPEPDFDDEDSNAGQRILWLQTQQRELAPRVFADRETSIGLHVEGLL